MKLSKEEILIIDQYLQKNIVSFIDIRYEMLDHIALAVEQKMEFENLDFKVAFKDYMEQHKKELLKLNSIFLKIASHKAFSILLNGLFKPISLSIYFILFAFFYLIANYTEIDYNSIFQIMNFTLFFPFGITYLYQVFSKIKKYSVANDILGLLGMLNYLLNVVFRVQYSIHNNNILFIYYALILGLGTVTFFTYKSIVNSYKTKYVV
jgi:hypothetical protein